MVDHGYGWKPSPPDHRDHQLFGGVVSPQIALPSSVDLRPKMPAIVDQGTLGSCFPAGTLIRMADGSERAIENVRLLDDVVTAEGNVGRVISTMVRQEEDGLVKLSLWGNSHLRLTREHPVLTRRGYVPAGDLQLGDWVALPKYLAETVNSVRAADFISTADYKLGRSHKLVKWDGLPGRSGLSGVANKIPEKLDLNSNTGRLIGLFLAEGSCSSGKATWTYGSHEVDTLVAETVSLLQSEWNVTAHVAHRPNNSINVTIHGTAWARLLSSLCGNGSGRKVMHSSLTAGPRDFLEAVLSGWLDGDGWTNRWRSKHVRVNGVTISHQLAMNMYDIAQALGRRPTVVHSESPQNSAAKVRQPRWTVSMSEANRSRSYSEQDDTHVWRRIRVLADEEFSGYVYNLSIEGDQSYVAEGVGVHNCTANMGAAAYFVVSKHVVSPLSRLFIYYTERVIENTIAYDSGATIRDCMKALKNYGAPPEGMLAYKVERFKIKPTSKVFAEALRHQLVAYAAVPQTPLAFKSALAAGHPICIGISVYESFESEAVAHSGMVPMPSKAESMMGGHAVLVVGYDDKGVLVRNSWGTGWGLDGYFYLPWEYVMNPNLASDFWVMLNSED